MVDSPERRGKRLPVIGKETKMAANIASELLYRLIHEKPFQRNVSSIPVMTPSGLSKFTTYLNNHYWIDTTRCYLNGKVNNNMIFELFANYSQNDARAVRRDLVEYSRTMRMDVGTSCHTAMRLKGFTNLDEWINHVEKPDSPGDEFVLYILGKMYYRHVIVMTGQNIWCTVENHHNMSIQDLLEV